MSEEFRMMGAVYPVLAIEYVALLIHAIAMVGVSVLLFTKLKVYIRCKGSNFIHAYLAMILLGLLIAESCHVLSRYPLPLNILKGVDNFLNVFCTIFYLMFQIWVFNRFREHTNISLRTIYVLNILTWIFFLAGGTPLMLQNVAFDPSDTNSNSIWIEWAAWAVLWFAYLIILDLVLNFALLRIFVLSKKPTGNEAADRKVSRLKRLLLILCILTVLNDILGVVADVLSFEPVVDEMGYRLSTAYGVFSNATEMFHSIIGLTYLNLLIDNQSRAVQRQPKAPEKVKSIVTSSLWTRETLDQS